jgi:hypothetical protein
MPFVLVAIGLMAVIIGVRGRQNDAVNLLREEFTGPQNFLTWLFAVSAVGALGYVPVFRDISRWFIGLIFVVMLFTTNRGFFDQLSAQLLNRAERPPTPDAANPAAPPLGGLAPLPEIPPLIQQGGP